MAPGGGRRRVFFQCKYCKALFDNATSLVAHKRFEHADQIFGKNPNNDKPDWGSSRPSDEKSPAKIRTYSPPVCSAKLQSNELPGPSSKFHKLPGISSNRKTDENTGLKCRFCPITLASTERLCEHERIHTGEKPYQCQHCLKGFTDKSATETHEKKCPVLEILKSEAKKRRDRHPIVFKAPSKNAFKPPKVAQSDSINSKPRSSDYVKNKINYVRRFAHNFHSKFHQRPKNPAGSFNVTKTEKLPFLPQLLKCIGSEGQVNFSCQQCNKKFICRASGQLHLRTHFGKEIFTCPVCKKLFSAIKQVVDHFKSHPTNITSTLREAPQISAFITSYSRFVHEDTDNHYSETEDTDQGGKVLTCKHCRYEIFSKPGVTQMVKCRHQMRLHIRRKHTKTNLYTCDHCHRGWPQKCEVQKHALTCKLRPAVTAKREDFRCPVCAIVFQNNDFLAVHKDGHSKLPFLCIKCGLWFRLAQDIKKHLAACVK